MANPSKEKLPNGQTSLNGHDLGPVTAQPVSGEKADIASQGGYEKTPPNKELEGNPSKTTSSISLAQRSTHDEEKGLPIDNQAEKEPAVVDTEHDPNIVDWDGEHDPENPLNWTAKKKWYAASSNITLHKANIRSG